MKQEILPALTGTNNMYIEKNHGWQKKIFKWIFFSWEKKNLIYTK